MAGKSISSSLTIRKRLMLWTLGLVLILGTIEVLLFSSLSIINIPQTIQEVIMQPTIIATSEPEVVNAPTGSVEQAQSIVGVDQIQKAVQRQVIRIAIVTTLVFVGIGILGASKVSQQALEPVLRLSKEVSEIDETTLSKRVTPVGADDELMVMTTSINRTLDRLETAFQTQEQFVLDAAHELRTPLSIIRSNFEVLENLPQNAETERAGLSVSLNRNVERMEVLVEDLLFLAKGETQYVSESINLAEIIGEICLDLDALAKVNDISLNFQTSENIILKGNSVLIDRLFRNLIVNAIQYSDKDGIVSISITRSVDEAKVSITDNGVGINPDELPFIFDRFYRCDHSRSRAKGGSGLGLATVKHIANLYQATVEVQSQPGEGSTFIVSFPNPNLS
ncbi:MAG: ATP-binding protein [Anaerolineaceae bacterium]